MVSDNFQKKRDLVVPLSSFVGLEKPRNSLEKRFYPKKTDFRKWDIGNISKSRGNKGISPLAIAIILLVAIGGTFAYFYYHYLQAQKTAADALETAGPPTHPQKINHCDNHLGNQNQISEFGRLTKRG